MNPDLSVCCNCQFAVCRPFQPFVLVLCSRFTKKDRRLSGIQLSIDDSYRPFGIRGNMGIMCNHHNGMSAVVKPLEQPHDLAAGIGIERPCRFIGQQQLRLPTGAPAVAQPGYHA